MLGVQTTSYTHLLFTYIFFARCAKNIGQVSPPSLHTSEGHARESGRQKNPPSSWLCRSRFWDGSLPCPRTRLLSLLISLSDHCCCGFLHWWISRSLSGTTEANRFFGGSPTRELRTVSWNVVVYVWSCPFHLLYLIDDIAWCITVPWCDGQALPLWFVRKVVLLHCWTWFNNDGPKPNMQKH